MLVSSEDVDRIVGGVRPTISVLDPCASWLVRDSRRGALGLDIPHC